MKARHGPPSIVELPCLYDNYKAQGIEGNICDQKLFVGD